MTLNESDTATAHLTWDERWKSADGRAQWLTPEPFVTAFAGTLPEPGRKRALDLGCGVGRHALYLAGLGFDTHALDGSAAGVAHLNAEAARNGLPVRASVGMMTALPYPDAHFDYVLSYNVIYHGDPDVIGATVAEIRRVLKPGGFYQGTMLSKRHQKFGLGRRVARDTFVIDGDGDKDHPHLYCDARDMVALFDGFEIRSLVDEEHRKTDDWHWLVVAERV
jgi:SAM-dependent methyltransferase